jgi:pimeloyl-ACP methyl ester carboxylesterase
MKKVGFLPMWIDSYDAMDCEKMREYSIKGIGSNILYHDFPGKEKPILFIHGLGCAGTFDYPDVATQKPLQNHRRILVDLLGAGYSDKPDGFCYTIKDHAKYLLEFVESIGLESFVLFGHSMGGAVALSMAQMDTNGISQIILSESTLNKSREGSISKYIAGFTEKEFVEQGFQRLIKESEETGYGIWAASLRMWSAKAAYRASRNLSVGENPSWRDILYSLNIPKTFIFGEKSLPNPDLEILPEHGVKVDIVEHAGHSMAWENPKGLAEAIGKAIV